jgi:hypothetical protein
MPFTFTPLFCYTGTRKANLLPALIDRYFDQAGRETLFDKSFVMQHTTTTTTNTRTKNKSNNSNNNIRTMNQISREHTQLYKSE